MIHGYIEDLMETDSLLKMIPPTAYTHPCPILSGGTIGQHVRHILEFYQCLANADDILCYELRSRSLEVEKDLSAARSLTSQLLAILPRKLTCTDQGKDRLKLSTNGLQNPSDITWLSSTFERELIFCIEHSIHHKALIKVGLKSIGMEHLVSDTYGVSPATIAHRHHYSQLTARSSSQDHG